MWAFRILSYVFLIDLFLYNPVEEESFEEVLKNREAEVFRRHRNALNATEMKVGEGQLWDIVKEE